MLTKRSRRPQQTREHSQMMSKSRRKRGNIPREKSFSRFKNCSSPSKCTRGQDTGIRIFSPHRNFNSRHPRTNQVAPWSFPESPKINFGPPLSHHYPLWYRYGRNLDPVSRLESVQEARLDPSRNVTNQKVKDERSSTKIDYKKFDHFSSPDLEQITSNCVTGQGLHKSVYIILILSTLGFVYQSWSVLSQYFSYQTITVLAISLPTTLVAPATSVCFPYLQILNRARIMDDYPNVTADNFNLETIATTLTILELFKYTPKADVNLAISSCLFRTPKSPQLFETKMCDGVMLLSKFYKQQFICYDVSLVTDSGFEYRNIRNSISSAGEILISVSETF